MQADHFSPPEVELIEGCFIPSVMCLTKCYVPESVIVYKDRVEVVTSGPRGGPKRSTYTTGRR